MNDGEKAAGTAWTQAAREWRAERDARERKPGAATPEAILPPPSEPMQVAREFVRHCCLDNEEPDALTLRYWRGGWWAWRVSHWIEIESHSVRALLYEFTEYASYVSGKTLAPWAPTRRKIGDLLEALGAIAILDDEIDQPCWIDGRSSGTIVSAGNGLLEVSSRRLLAHSPLYFNQTAVPFDYNFGAPAPRQWLDFLERLWPSDPTAIDALAEWYGYVVSGRTDLHKILLTVGPTRGGKGVIARVLTELIGKRNVCGPTLSSLGNDFGLQPLIGKPLAVISDARFVGRQGNVVVERLLSISGEDSLTVDRKYRDAWTGKLPCRLHIISNELPRLGDASTAVVGRIVLLLLTQSWLGREDHELEQRLRGELASILNWALDGLERLTVANGNRFTRVAAAEEAIVSMRDLASPVQAFVREKCVVDDADREIEVDALYGAYKLWCEDNQHAKASKHAFGRDLRAAVPAIRKTRPRDGKDRRQLYAGVALRTAEDEEGAFCDVRPT
jgi:putative DNA primase/helicase